MKATLFSLLAILLLSGCQTTKQQEKQSVVKTSKIPTLTDSGVASIANGNSGLYRSLHGNVLAVSNVDNLSTLSNKDRIVLNYLVGKKRTDKLKNASGYDQDSGLNAVHYIHIEKNELNELINNVSKRTDYQGYSLNPHSDAFTAMHELSHFFMHERTHKVYSNLFVSRSKHESVADVSGLMLLAKHKQLTLNELINVSRDLSKLRSLTYRITKNKDYDTAYGINNFINYLQKDGQLFKKIYAVSNHHLTGYAKKIVDNKYK